MFSHLFVITSSVAIIQCLETHEPKCYSKSDWEDKLLEKSIRTEFAMQQYVKSMETALEEIRAHKDEFNMMRSTLKETVEELKASVNATVKELKTAVESQTSQAVETVTKFKGELQTPSVIFSARTLADLSPSQGQIMIFSTIIQNIGNGYDSSTGIFTAPVSGTYIFNVQFCVHNGKWAQFQLVVDRSDNLILTFRHFNSVSADAMATGIAHYQSEGQKIWVQSYTSSTSSSNLFEHTSSDCWNQFSGALVHH